jgi:hypothetical protein
MSHVARMVRMHARIVTDAAALEASSARHRIADPERSMRAADEAAELRANADALVTILRDAGADILFPDPRQMALLSDGGHHE